MRCRMQFSGRVVGSWLLAAGFVAIAGAQDAGAPPAEQAPSTAPAATQPALPEGAQEVLCRVIDVFGDAEWAPLESQAWKPVQMDDAYSPGTKIRTGVRSSVKFQVGDEEPYTAFVIDSIGLTYLSEVYKTAEMKKVRLGVSYGQIRGGVAEGGLRSEFTIDTPEATLSKRGTWAFGIFYERGTGRFEIFLLDRGLVQALNRVRGTQRGVLPGERVTQAMRLFLDQAQIDRNVPIADVLGQSDVEVAFNRLQNDGLGVLGPGQGRTYLINLSNASAQQAFGQLAQNALQQGGGFVPPPPVPTLRAEGFFGTGRGDDLVRVLIEADNPLAKGGHARPGQYMFRRSALQEWLQQNRR